MTEINVTPGKNFANFRLNSKSEKTEGRSGEKKESYESNLR